MPTENCPHLASSERTGSNLPTAAISGAANAAWRWLPGKERCNQIFLNGRHPFRSVDQLGIECVLHPIPPPVPGGTGVLVVSSALSNGQRRAFVGLENVSDRWGMITSGDGRSSSRKDRSHRSPPACHHVTSAKVGTAGSPGDGPSSVPMKHRFSARCSMASRAAATVSYVRSGERAQAVPLPLSAAPTQLGATARIFALAASSASFARIHSGVPALQGFTTPPAPTTSASASKRGDSSTIPRVSARTFPGVQARAEHQRARG